MNADGEAMFGVKAVAATTCLHGASVRRSRGRNGNRPGTSILIPQAASKARRTPRCRPECADIDGESRAKAGGRVTIKGARAGVDDDYYMEEVEHTYAPQTGFTTRIDVSKTGVANDPGPIE